jgi:rod shape-determining protein MreC
LKGSARFQRLWPWVILIGTALFTLSANAGQDRTWNPFERLIVQFSAPLVKGVSETVGMVKDVWLGYFYLVDLRRQNLILHKELDRLQRENSRFRETLATDERLRELLQFKEDMEQPAIAAQVIARDPSGWFKSILISKGQASGVKVDMAVVNAQGVVGRVVSVSSDYAKVLLVIDQNSAVDCLIQRSRERGMVKGVSARVCKVDYLARTSDVAVGDLVVTSGLGGVFPKGILIGRVEKVIEGSGEFFKDVVLTPAVDFGRLEEVLVVLKETALSDYTGKKP